jgi:ABC-type antimicrobial peptide transport system permease subunit
LHWACRWQLPPDGLISAQLYGVSFWDPLALMVAASSLTICAFLAALIPASRAASISPMSALRNE